MIGGFTAIPPTSIRALRAQQAAQRAAQQVYQRVPTGVPQQPAGRPQPAPGPAPTQQAPTQQPAPPPQQAPSSRVPPQQGPTVVVVEQGAPIEPEIVPPEPLVVVEQGDPPLSPFGRAVVGAAIGGLLSAAFELPGGPVLGVLAGGAVGFYLPRRGGRRV